MESNPLSQLEEEIIQLPIGEQLRLMERVAHRLRVAAMVTNVANAQLAAMALDTQIQNELRAIDEEFSPAESDGLEAR